MQTGAHVPQYLAEFFSELEMFRTTAGGRTRLPSVKQYLYRILMEFGIGVPYKNLVNKLEFRENRLSDGHNYVT